MKILIVDDHEYNRELLSFIMEDEGYQYVEAANGFEACEACEQDDDISVVLMDVTMPKMDGITATKKIKESKKERMLPVIFVTALDDAQVLSNCLEAGGDDFVPKPINDSVLLAKIKAHARTAEIYQNLKSAKKQLELHKIQTDREHAIVERIFQSAAQRIKTDCVNINKYSSPMSMFNGDIILEAPSPSGGVYNLVGDFTGHGLAASIGTLPITEIFYRLSAKQASIGQFAKEINHSLYELLPTNMFFCAALTYLDAAGRGLSIWAGGMNDMLLFPADGAVVKKIGSEHMPLGILNDEEFDETPLLLEVKHGDRMYVYTDGVNEAENSAGEEFGLSRIESLLAVNGAAESAVTEFGEDVALTRLISAVHEFQKGGQQGDDISILGISVAPLIHKAKSDGQVVDIAAQYHIGESFPWQFSMRLQKEELRNTSIVDQMMTFVGGIEGIELHREKIFTIVSELYSNALEHGVLELDSDLKVSADGFEEYYKLRAERLKNLDEHYIDVDFLFEKGDVNSVVLKLTDSGKGFDFSSTIDSLEENASAFGRGLPLLQTLCSDIEFSNGGRSVVARYELRLYDN